MTIECRRVSRAFASRQGRIDALEEVTFTLARREFVCLVGPSGCGKTTLLRILAGLLAPTSGEVIFRDTASGPQPPAPGHHPPKPGPPGTTGLKHPAPWGRGSGTARQDRPWHTGGGESSTRSPGERESGQAARPRCAMVFQEHGLFPWMPLLENVAFGLKMQGVGKRARRRRAGEFIARMGLDRFARHYPHELSVGMRQRAGLARAFVADPDVLLMDEPLGSVDAQTKLILQEELLHIWRQDEKLVLYVTHDIREAVLLGDRVLVMSGRPGRIREEVSVPLPRPRDLAVLDRPEVTHLVEHIWGAIEDEVRKNLSTYA